MHTNLMSGQESSWLQKQRAYPVQIHCIFLYPKALGCFFNLFGMQCAGEVVDPPASFAQEVIVGIGLGSTCLRVGLMASSWSSPLCTSSSKVLYTVPRESEGISDLKAIYLLRRRMGCVSFQKCQDSHSLRSGPQANILEFLNCQCGFVILPIFPFHASIPLNHLIIVCGTTICASPDNTTNLPEYRQSAARTLTGALIFAHYYSSIFGFAIPKFPMAGASRYPNSVLHRHKHVTPAIRHPLYPGNGNLQNPQNMCHKQSGTQFRIYRCFLPMSTALPDGGRPRRA